MQATQAAVAAIGKTCTHCHEGFRNCQRLSSPRVCGVAGAPLVSNSLILRRSINSARPGVGQFAARDIAARRDPLVHFGRGQPEQLGQQRVHFLFELTEVARPFGGLGQADVLFALPLHGMKQQHAVGRHQAPRAGRKRPQRGRRTFAGHDAGHAQPRSRISVISDTAQ